ncbi:FISUMP domain-containing protein [[Flexibacter] sp. ATCC 35208]|uniref:FISUMP domain-containing protein n=1 Tax=[Flexibacter] sp. ATCC 35208 TaxID=1936242 RepID=UPI0009F89DED|nr:FISUMP domain-containing protein [[Flexibacter] sp. ATCC 35208]
MSTYAVSSDPVYFSMANPDAGNQPQLYVEVTATLNITIVNNTGADITLQGGNADTASGIELFMPNFFTADQKAGMTINNISQPGWSFSYDAPYKGLLLAYGNTSGTWAKDTSLTFTIINVTATASPTIGAVNVNLNNLNGQNVPAGLQSQNLALNSSAPPQAVDLTTVLNLGLDNQGTVYVSAASDPLSNTIFLNINNTANTPLYNDTKPWTGNPTVTVSFVYGNTAGALAPADNSGQAWDIGVTLVTNQSWVFKNPTNTGDGNTPVWTLYPQSSNTGIIGTGNEANLTFAFNNINSFTPAGHTQMMVTFNNFMMNSTTAYKPVTFILDISKQNPPSTRGLFNFFGTNGSIIALTEPSQTIQIPLRWAMFYVDNIKLICNIPGAPMLQKNYFLPDQSPNIQPLAYDTYTLTLPIQVSQETPVFITLQAFDNNNNYLNALQFTVFISASFFVDPNGQVYPTVFLNNQTWLAANYNYNSGNGCVAYDNNSSNRKQYGMLYTEAQAQTNTPAGWRIPSQDDWNNLFTSLGANAFAALINGGSSGFNAQAGGMGDNLGNFNSLLATGYYWTSTANNQQPGNNFDTAFFLTQKSVNAKNSIDRTYFLSVRYVKNT